MSSSRSSIEAIRVSGYSFVFDNHTVSSYGPIYRYIGMLHA